MRKYFSMEQAGSAADIVIYGDITSWPWSESDVSSYTLIKALEGLNAETVNVYINSYGGEVAEGLAIYNALKRHPAKVTTYCDGFACSAASVVFMAGDERVMGAASLIMIHNAWTWAEGNAEALRKEADDLEAISAAAANAYRGTVTISEEELVALLKAETWIPPEDAVRMGFATSIAEDIPNMNPSQSARRAVMAALRRPIAQTLNPEEIAHQVFIALRAEAQATSQVEPPAMEPKENKTLTLLSALMRPRKD